MAQQIRQGGRRCRRIPSPALVVAARPSALAVGSFLRRFHCHLTMSVMLPQTQVMTGPDSSVRDRVQWKHGAAGNGPLLQPQRSLPSWQPVSLLSAPGIMHGKVCASSECETRSEASLLLSPCAGSSPLASGALRELNESGLCCYNIRCNAGLGLEHGLERCLPAHADFMVFCFSACRITLRSTAMPCETSRVMTGSVTVPALDDHERERERAPETHLAPPDGVHVFLGDVFFVGLFAQVFELLLGRRDPEGVLVERLVPVEDELRRGGAGRAGADLCAMQRQCVRERSCRESNEGRTHRRRTRTTRRRARGPTR